MSRETIEHLNTNTLIGNTDQRGTAWHYRAEEQGEENNHYPGAIPVADVGRRLFDWEAVSRPIGVELPADVATMSHLTETGEPARWVPQPDRQAICRSDTGALMGIFAPGYQMHQYKDWLLTTVANVLDDDLVISSAGLLRGGAIAWVEVSIPDSITTPEGVVFRPNLLATTSFDGSIATTFKRTVCLVICDNTREVALGEKGQTYKVKHSKYSHAQLAPAREALALVHDLADDFAAEVAELCRVTVSDQQWELFLNSSVPRTDAGGLPLKGRALTTADRKRDSLQNLWRNDRRVAPWAQTAYGVVQAVNTWEHHESAVRGLGRPERNMLRTVTGAFAKIDQNTMETLQRVLV